MSAYEVEVKAQVRVWCVTCAECGEELQVKDTRADIDNDLFIAVEPCPVCCDTPEEEG